MKGMAVHGFRAVIVFMTDIELSGGKQQVKLASGLRVLIDQSYRVSDQRFINQPRLELTMRRQTSREFVIDVERSTYFYMYLRRYEYML